MAIAQIGYFCNMSKILHHKQLLDFTNEVFLKMGCSSVHAEVGANALVSADLRGIDSHGVARLSGYIRLWEVGRVNATPSIKVIHETPSTAVVDGDSGLGLVVAPYAMSVAIQKAESVGTGWVSVSNSNHFGIAAHHAMKALDKDMIGIVMTNASALVAPTFSKERMLGTNPICVAIPAGIEPPFIADMATTTAANGKLEILQRKELEAPLGWIQDIDGHPSSDAHALKNGGSLLPLGGSPEGGSGGGHKGYALGSIVDIFSAILSGANFGPWVPPFPAYVPMPENQPGKGIGHFFGAMRIDAFRPADEFKKDMDLWIKRFRSAEPIHPQQPVLIPGDPEREMEKVRTSEGIPLHDQVWNDLRTIAEKFNIKF
jgi:LDH2 family malate/lactate/ureidoglycolate dehydrogenase